MKCLSINLWNINNPLEERMSALDRFVERERPDIICFQEVSRVANDLQITNICNKYSYNLQYEKSGEWLGREEGLAIASLYDFVDIHRYELPMTNSYNDMQRILFKCSILYHDKLLNVYNTHLAYHINSNETRKYQNEFIANQLKNDNNSASTFILCGDFNCFNNESTIFSFLDKNGVNYFSSNDNLMSSYTFDSSNQYCSPELWPNRNLDYILFSKNGDFTGRLCMTGRDGFQPCSDHYGVIISGDFYNV